MQVVLSVQEASLRQEHQIPSNDHLVKTAILKWYHVVGEKTLIAKKNNALEFCRSQAGSCKETLKQGT